MLNVKQLEELSLTPISKTDKTKLIDINTVHVDTTLPEQARILDYLEQVVNPYCFICGKTPVRVCFSPNGKELDTLLKSYFKALKNS